jgi:hypothetical protein
LEEFDIGLGAPSAISEWEYYLFIHLPEMSGAENVLIWITEREDLREWPRNKFLAMNKPRTKLELEYIVVPEKNPGERLNAAFKVLFEEVMKDRKAKMQAKNKHEIASIQV